MKKIFLVTVFLFAFLFISPEYSNVYAESLYIRTTKSYVEPGTFYDLIVLSSRVPFVGYTGLLDVTVTSCNQSGICNTTTGPWGNYSVQNGSIRLDIAADYTPSRFRARFKPRNSTWDWSNEIQVDVGMTQDLENSQDYWLLSSAPADFTGYNFADNKSFKTVIGFKPQETFCPNTEQQETVQTMYFMKNNTSGYWDPHYPWFSRVGDNNLLWHLSRWQSKPSWVSMGYDDEYLTSIGNGRYTYIPADPFNLSANFKTQTVQLREQFPNYILSPKWVGNGWGINVDSYSSGPHPPGESFCDLATNTSGPNTWIVQADIVNIDLPLYKGPALKYKYYEGPHDCLIDATKDTLREDWYFVKNMGLVEIDQKYFGPDYGIRKTCQEDNDCLMNEIMDSPHIRLVRTDLLLPGDLNADSKVDRSDYTILVNNFGKTGTPGFISEDINKDGKVDIFDYNVLVANFGK